MAQKLHVNPETGKVGKCTASVRDCEFGESNHFDNPVEAIRHAEEIIKESLDEATVKTVTKKRSKYGEDKLNKEVKEVEDKVAAGKFDIPEVSQIDLTDRKLAEAGYFEGDSVSEIRNNLLNTFEKVKYANLSNKIRHEFDLEYGENAEIVWNDDLNEPTVLVKTWFTDSDRNWDDDTENELELMVDRKKVGDKIEEEVEYSYDSNSGDEIPVHERREYFALTEAEKQEYKDDKTKELIKNKVKLIGDERFPDWIAMPKRLAANTNALPKVSAGLVRTVQYHVDKASKDVLALKNENNTLKKLEDQKSAVATEFANELSKDSADTGDLSGVLGRYNNRLKGIMFNISKTQKRIEKYSDAPVRLESAKKELALREREHYNYRRQQFVHHLSTHYPSDSKTVRYAVAEKWVDDNKDKFKEVEDFDSLINNN